jgi:hypothetical protein
MAFITSKMEVISTRMMLKMAGEKIDQQSGFVRQMPEYMWQAAISHSVRCTFSRAAKPVELGVRFHLAGSRECLYFIYRRWRRFPLANGMRCYQTINPFYAMRFSCR